MLNISIIMANSALSCAINTGSHVTPSFPRFCHELKFWWLYSHTFWWHSLHFWQDNFQTHSGQNRTNKPQRRRFALRLRYVAGACGPFPTELAVDRKSCCNSMKTWQLYPFLKMRISLTKRISDFEMSYCWTYMENLLFKVVLFLHSLIHVT